MVEARSFPPPWSVEETDACFIVRDGKAAKIWCKQRHMEYVIAAIG